MGRLILVIVILIALVAAFGFYQGWFHLSSNSSQDTSAVTLTVDKTKLSKDEQLAREKVQAVGSEVKNKVAPTTAPAKNP